MRVLVDSNIWISALLTPGGHCAELRERWISGQFDLLISDHVLAELAEVPLRPRIQRKYKIDPRDVGALLQLLQERAICVPITGQIKLCRDPDDDAIVEAAMAGSADALVTHDDDIKSDREVIRLLRERGVRPLSLSQFLQELGRPVC